MRRPFIERLALALSALLTCQAAQAETTWEALRQPGVVAIMRHALAPGTGDPANFRLGDCSTQRNLDETGQDQARQIGEALRENGIVIDRVLSSQVPLPRDGGAAGSWTNRGVSCAELFLCRALDQRETDP